MNTSNTITEGTKFTKYGHLNQVVYEITENKVRYHDVKFIGTTEGKNKFGHWMSLKKFNQLIAEGDIIIA